MGNGIYLKITGVTSVSVKGKNGKYDFANTMKKSEILCKYTYMK
jgi:hypothetical protein